MTDEAQVQERGVEEAVVADDSLEGVDAQQEGGPERQHHDEQQQPLGRPWTARDGVGHGVAEREADQGGEERRAQRVQIGDAIHFIGEQVAVVAEGERELQVVVAREGDDVGKRRHARRGLGEADFEGEGERNEKEYDQEDQRQQNDEPAARTPGRFHDARFECASGLLCGINFAPVHLSPVRRLPPAGRASASASGSVSSTPASPRCTSTGLRALPWKRSWRWRTCRRAWCASTSIPRPRCWSPRSSTWRRSSKSGCWLPWPNCSTRPLR